MNKQEVLEELEKTSTQFFRVATSTGVEANNKTLSTGVFAGLGIAKSVLTKLEEPPEVKVPLLVGNWIEYSKDEGWDFLRSTEEMTGPMGDGSVRIWFKKNSDKYAEAWINDFEVEQESKYHLVLPHITKMTHGHATKIHNVSTGVTKDLAYDIFSEEEIKEIDERYWPFAVPVEKV